MKYMKNALTKCNSLPSIRRFVGEIGPKKSKNNYNFKSISLKLDFIFFYIFWHGWNRRHPKHIKNSATTWIFTLIVDGLPYWVAGSGKRGAGSGERGVDSAGPSDGLVWLLHREIPPRSHRPLIRAWRPVPFVISWRMRLTFIVHHSVSVAPNLSQRKLHRIPSPFLIGQPRIPPVRKT